MSTGFKIDFAWIPRDFGDALERLSLAGITIEAGGVTVTEVEDSEARTTRPEIYVSAFDLSRCGWWRIGGDCDGKPMETICPWRMSHRMGAAGNGYLWPDVEFHQWRRHRAYSSPTDQARFRAFVAVSQWGGRPHPRTEFRGRGSGLRGGCRFEDKLPRFRESGRSARSRGSVPRHGVSSVRQSGTRKRASRASWKPEWALTSVRRTPPC